MIETTCTCDVSASSTTISRVRRCWTLFELICALTWLVGPSATTARGQSADPLTSIGVPSFSAALPVENGVINAANGNLHLEFPLGIFLQRGGAPVKVALTYDSTIWGQVNCCGIGDGIHYSEAGRVKFGSNYIYLHGWKFMTSADDGLASNNVVPSLQHCSTDGVENYDTISQWTWAAPDGTLHAFPIKTVVGLINSCGNYTSLTQPNGDALALDASGYHMYVTNVTSATVYAPDGTQVYTDRYNGTKNPKDTNGNYFLQDSQYNINDTLGRTIVTTVSNGNTITFTVLNSQGTTTYTATVQSINVHTNFASIDASDTDLSGSINVISSIHLPDGKSYFFGYDSGTTAGHYGQLTSMTLPTVGQITYSYANFLDPEYVQGRKHITRGISTRTTPGGQWTYTPAVITSCTSALQATCEQSLTVKKPSSDNTVYTVDLRRGTLPIQVDYYTGAISPSKLLATLTQSFDTSLPCVYQSTPYFLCSSWQSIYVTKTAETTALTVSGGAKINQRTQYTWNSTHNGNMMNKSEWNFYRGSLPTTADRATAATYLPPYTGSNNNNTGANMLNRPASVKVTDKDGNTASTVNSYDGAPTATLSGAKNHDDSNYGTGYNSRGNLTRVQRLISGTSNYATTSQTYDETGQVTTSKDANGNQTSYGYGDRFFTDHGDTPILTPYTPATLTNAYLTSITRPYSQISTFGYYWGKGQEAKSTDPNSQSTVYHFYDVFDRPTSTILPDQGWTFVQYPSENEVDKGTGETSTTLLTNCPTSGNVCRHDQTLMDGLGRVTSQNLVNDPAGQDTVATVYDSNGRIQKISNPYRSMSDPTFGWTTFSYDGLDRVVQITHPDGSISNTSYGAGVGTSSQLCSSPPYAVGYPVLKVDEAGKRLESWTDGFGGIVEADEPDSNNSLTVNTCYKYDLNSNIVGVLAAGGIQTRSFSYDMLSRLSFARNPESASTNYYYTTSGNSLCSGDPSAVCRRTDARGFTTTYSYDALNRLSYESFSDGTYRGGFSYSETTSQFGNPVSNGIGRLTTSWQAYGGQGFSYDRMGRPIQVRRVAYSSTRDFFYVYNLDGTVKTLQYPSGRVVTYGYNAVGQPVSVTDSNGTHYISNATYWANGAGFQVWFLPIYQRTDMNNRLQISGLYADNGLVNSYYLDKHYGYNGGQNNGNVMSITNNRDPNRTQTFTYDKLDRISTAYSQANTGPYSWGDNYSPDTWGNLKMSPMAGKVFGDNFQLSTDVNNHVIGMSYDGAGNLLNDGATAYSYDAGGMLKTAGSTTYWYDADGQRFTKWQSGIANKTYFYGAGGDLLAEGDGGGTLTAEYVYFSGKRVARIDLPAGTVHYYLSDHLNSTSMVVSASGTIEEESDYLPFGRELVVTGPGPNHFKFTGKEHDFESNLDNFGARYNSSQMGRFMSPDPGNIGVDRLNPQSWNAYSYSLNNPLSLTDPTGLYVCEDSTKCDSKNDQGFAKSLADAQTAANKLTGDDQAAAQRAIDAYGAQGVDNGVNLRFDANIKGGDAVTEVSGVANGNKSADNPTGQNINVTFRPGAVGGDLSGSLVAHEGSHVADGSEWVKSGFSPSMNPTRNLTEMNANHAQFNILNVQLGMMYPNGYTGSLYGGSVGWKKDDTFKMITPELQKAIQKENGASDTKPAFRKGAILQP
jgi:RHS repeat-associated protein